MMATGIGKRQPTGRQRLGQLLLERGWINGEQLIRAVQSQRAVGGRIGTCLLEMDAVSEDRLLEALAEQLGVPPVRIDQLRSIADDTLELVPATLAVRYRTVPFESSTNELQIAALNVSDLEQLDAIAFCTDKRVRPHIANEARLFEALERFYGIECPQRYGHLLDRLNRTRYLWNVTDDDPSAAQEEHDPLGMPTVRWMRPDEVFGPLVEPPSQAAAQRGGNGRPTKAAAAPLRSTPAPRTTAPQEAKAQAAKAQATKAQATKAQATKAQATKTAPVPSPAAKPQPRQPLPSTSPKAADNGGERRHGSPAAPPAVVEPAPEPTPAAAPAPVAEPAPTAPPVPTVRAKAAPVAQPAGERESATRNGSDPNAPRQEDGQPADRPNVGGQQAGSDDQKVAKKDEADLLELTAIIDDRVPLMLTPPRSLDDVAKDLVAQQSPGGIADVLLSFLSGPFVRCGVLRGGRGELRGWKAFGPDLREDAFETVSIPTDRLLSRGVSEGSAPPTTIESLDESVAACWSEAPTAGWIVIPVCLKQRVVCAIIGHRDGRTTPPRLLSQLEALAGKVALALELCILRKKILGPEKAESN